MRSILAFSFALVFTLASAAAAQTTGRAEGALAVDDPQARIDGLFFDLKRAGNPAAAQRISQRIRDEWAKSGSATVDLLMARAGKAADDKKHGVALDLLDEIVTLAPGYAEGWNLRATVHFSRDDYARAMADIERVLRLEPRHFGALAGMAAILRTTGRTQAAIGVYERMLDVYPMLRDAQTELGKLADEMAGQGI